MAQQQHKAPKKAQDPYAQRGKSLASTVQRLRGWVGSDPARVPELADALVELTAHRLLGHFHTAAVADAQEAVRLAAQLLSATGPIGPYTSVTDAVRCITTVVHVATVQAGLGRPEAAGRTVESTAELREQLRELRVEEQLLPQTAIWALTCTARSALAAGNAGTANAYADAVLDRLLESGLADVPDPGYLAMDADLLVSDCRWSAGRTEEALTHLHTARERYDALVAGRLQEPGRLSPALTERLAEPAFGLYRDLADRLAATGEVDLALTTRRSLVDLLQKLTGRLGDVARTQLASTLADLAHDLLAADRVEEAAVSAAESLALGRKQPGAEATRLLAATAQAEALTRSGRAEDAVALLRQELPADDAGLTSPAVALALGTLVEALDAAGDRDAAEATRDTLSALTRTLLGNEGELPTAAGQIRDLARSVVSRGRQPVSWEPLSPRSAYAGTTAGARHVDAADREAEQQRETAAWLEAERVEAHRREEEQRRQARAEAERLDAERAAAEREAAARAAEERERAERDAQLALERQAAAEEAERQARKLRREERLEAHRLEEQAEAERRELERAEAERLRAERQRAESDEVELARQAWQDARDRGDRRGARAALERLVEALRPWAQVDPGEHGPALRQALEDLSSARLRGGDVFGSRSASREARALARSLGG